MSKTNIKNCRLYFFPLPNSLSHSCLILFFCSSKKVLHLQICSANSRFGALKLWPVKVHSKPEGYITFHKIVRTVYQIRWKSNKCSSISPLRNHAQHFVWPSFEIKVTGVWIQLFHIHKTFQITPEFLSFRCTHICYVTSGSTVLCGKWEQKEIRFGSLEKDS